MTFGPDDFLPFCHKTEEVEKKKDEQDELEHPVATHTGGDHLRLRCFFIYG